MGCAVVAAQPICPFNVRNMDAPSIAVILDFEIFETLIYHHLPVLAWLMMPPVLKHIRFPRFISLAA
jgi:hypothetical protein